ncbi:DNA repair protein RAD51 homolog 4 isoform X2 [Bradysia coprophila]|uniref:DNA repair protein RAD51 homolog 4 isoform X2 n=1 Tax=Bradysia coprophila TaxID=38358 RepID=UPI00187DC3D1|nr:DNA repair protein RAD51 homolog 4 isoform X2 [Bradysia coprophila]
MDLHPSMNKFLTERIISLLNKNDIFTISDFVKEDLYKLTQITKLDREAITKVKDNFVRLLSPHKGFGFQKEVIRTGIDSFDDLLGGGLKSGNLYDICGLSGTGKTLICNIIAVHFAEQYKYGTLYVDAKNDFSGQRIYNMLNARQCSDAECGVIMNSIRCESIYDVRQFLKILLDLPDYLDKHKDVKCLIVDSLPSLWLPLMDVNGVHLLSKATNLMHKIAFTHDIIFLLINIVTRRTETESNFERFKTTTNVALGSYWRTVPRQRILLERTDLPKTQSTGQRTVKILKGEGKGKTCIVNITNKGVV